MATKKYKALVSAPAESEVDAYHFIRATLKELGWSLRNPSRYSEGQVWTQNQCFEHPLLKEALNLLRPENIVKLSETKVWVIEAKSTKPLLAKALREAEEDYAKAINKKTKGIKAVLISGVAGNDGAGYDVRSKLLVKGKFETVTINGIEATGLLDPATVDALLESGNPNIADYQVNESLFLKTAEQINATLHNGGINKNDRSRVMAALLLALVETSSLDLDVELPVLIGDINNRTDSALRRHGKREFHPFVRIESPTNSDSHVKYKAAIVRTIQQLQNLNIKSAMNSGTDVLGKFYEVFLRYGNGAKEIGIVLTPRHVTRFAVDTIGVSANDIVFDPACGTGGFLVAAFDHVRERTKGARLDKFKRFGLFGIEQESAIAALAIVNMIFRGDGKNNIVEANSFSKFLARDTVEGHATARYVKEPVRSGDEPVTRVFMNPPFALKKSDEHEWKFVEAALKSMADGGLLLAIVPMSVVSEGGSAGAWRRPLLASHTVVSVVSLPEELFYPVSVQSVAIVLRKGIPHDLQVPVMWARVTNDGYRKSKGKRYPIPGTNDLDILQPKLRAFISDPRLAVPSEPERLKVAPIDFSDPILELSPEAYLDSSIPSNAELKLRLDRQVRDNIAAFVALDLRSDSIGEKAIISRATASTTASFTFPTSRAKFREFALGDLFNLYAGTYHNLNELDEGTVPVASCADGNNGIAGNFDVQASNKYSHAMTIAFNGSPLTAKLHPYEFGAKDDVAVAVPNNVEDTPLPPEALIFIQAQINSERWRFSYYRKCFRAKLGRTTVELPCLKNGSLDVAYMVNAVRAQPFWWFLGPRLTPWATMIPAPEVARTASVGEEAEID
ncbi:class I SAM-dependent DNA methyltransferase [Variovorax sp. KBW07]|uniref:HsdM family class I SAM-dependent methyltransferase n=1 Tax=Variovorax sp. KBW07 TaxID=2153358 RepID=UPI0021A9D282|nr:SAM-dependent methyltransferase [Variovorax sp. KBW07]